MSRGIRRCTEMRPLRCPSNRLCRHYRRRRVTNSRRNGAEREERSKKYYNLRENERDLLERFDKATYGGGYFGKNHRPPVCEKLMGDWWEMTDYGFIHAARGIGKSFFALALCHALTTGQEIAGWKVPEPRESDVRRRRNESV